MGFDNASDKERAEFPKRVIRWNDKFAKAGMSPTKALAEFYGATRKAAKNGQGRESVLSHFRSLGVQFGYHDYGNGTGIEESVAFLNWMNTARTRLIELGKEVPELQRGGTGRKSAVDVDELNDLLADFED